MEHHVDAFGQLIDELPVADVAFDHRDGAIRLGPGQVVAAPAHEVVQYNDLARAGLHDEIAKI